MASLDCLIIHTLFLYSIIFVSSNQLCNQAEVCIGATLNDPGTTQVRGYKAAYDPSTSFSGGQIQCSASFSCHSMQFMRAYSASDPWAINCKGRDSCSNTIMESNDSNIYCSGANSCSVSNIATTYNANITCGGYLSCANADMHGVELIEGFGFLSVYNATIDSINSVHNTIIIELQGSLAGFGAKLICRENHTCYIHCQGFNSCYMFYTECIGQCIVNTSLISPPPTTNITQFNTVNHDIIPKSFESEATVPSNELCITNKLNVDDFEESRYGPDITVKVQGPLCCRGDSSCRNINEIRFQTETEDLMCDGNNACRDSNIISNNGTVYCQGQDSCWESSISYAHDVYCAAKASCRESVISDVSYIVCTGQSSCSYSTFISNGLNLHVYFVGRSSGTDATIYCNDTDSCNVYCHGLTSCQNTVLYCEDNCVVECNETNSHPCPVVYSHSSLNITPVGTDKPATISTMHSISSTDTDMETVSPMDTITSTLVSYLTALNLSKSPIFTTDQVNVNIKEKQRSNGWVIAVVIGVCCLVFGILIIIGYSLMYRNKVRETEQKVEEQEFGDHEAEPEPEVNQAVFVPYNDTSNVNAVDIERNRNWSEGMQRETETHGGGSDPQNDFGFILSDDVFVDKLSMGDIVDEMEGAPNTVVQPKSGEEELLENANTSAVVIGDNETVGGERTDANANIIYNMDANCDEIVIGDDEVTTGR